MKGIMMHDYFSIKKSRAMDVKIEGVTLLEIMLVLAIAAMIIVMSVRYYQSATMAQQTNAFVEQLQGIAAAMDSLSQGSGTYSTVSTSQLATVLPQNGLKTPWGATIKITPKSDHFEIDVTPLIPYKICLLMINVLRANSHFTMSGKTSMSHYDCGFERDKTSPLTLMEYWQSP